jgi:elongator complex protein 3
MFKKIYTDGDYMPDMVKIYPCVVNEYADLHELYKAGKYKPYTDKQLLDLITKIKKITPPWVRIARLIRDIPEESIIAGNKITNLRQLLQEQAKKDGWQCQCIRCREAGHQTELRIKNYELRIRKYQASGGTEYFLSYESKDQKILYAFLRLRLPQNPLPTSPFVRGRGNYLPELQGAALVRELHTYGEAVPLGQTGQVQHLGLGKKLLAEAEKLALKNGYKKIAVISGVGVRKYYEKFGYQLEGTYMVKNLN